MSNVVKLRTARCSATAVPPQPVQRKNDVYTNIYVLTLGVWYRNWSLRRHLARDLAGQPDSVLLDMGMTRQKLHEELAKPFWRT